MYMLVHEEFEHRTAQLCELPVASYGKNRLQSVASGWLSVSPEAQEPECTSLVHEDSEHRKARSGARAAALQAIFQPGGQPIFLPPSKCRWICQTDCPPASLQLKFSR